MKTLCLLIISAVTVFAGWHSNYASKSVDQAKSEPKCTIVIDRVAYLSIGGLNTMKSGIDVYVLLINNSDDTIEYAYSRCLNSVLYSIDFKNLVLVGENSNCEGKNAERTIILPHKYAYANLDFIYRKAQTTDFKFKIGFHFLKWKNSYSVKPPDDKEIENADLLWSNTQLFNAGPGKPVGQETADGYRKQVERAKLIYDTLSADQQKNYTLKINANQ